VASWQRSAFFGGAATKRLWYNEVSPIVDEEPLVSDSANQNGTEACPGQLPEFLRACFWDHPFDQIDFAAHREFVVGRVLSAGDWNAITWLRQAIGETAVREWIVAHEGRGLDPQQLRFWELILDIPEAIVTAWLAARGHGWDDRVRR
jgi:hypothetical protein